MARIFISYRRADSGESARKLYDALSPHFHVFMDVEGILVGKDFRAIIEREIIQSDVVLIVIGPQWVSITDEAGMRRLDKPNDLVRIEAEMALRHEKIVIPVTVAGAAMPSADAMPASLSNLPFLNGERIRPDQHDSDTARLIRQIKRALGLEVEPTQTIVTTPSEPHPFKELFRNTIWFTGAITVGLTAIWLIGNVLLQILNLSPTLTPTTAALNSTQSTPLDSLQIVGLTQTFEAGQTLTAIPTVTPTPTIDFNATVDAIATGTRAAQQTAIVETQIAEYAQQTAEAAATLTAMPTRTPTPTPDPLQVAYATAAAYDYRAGNTAWSPITQDFDGVIIVLVPAGCFDMGTSDDQAEYAINELGAQLEWLDDEKPVNQQCFDAPFWIDQTEVTQADFERQGGQKANSNAFDGDQRPVEGITWFEARDFCALRGMRLPTEREWEYAARGPDNLIYPWGNGWNPEYAVWGDNSGGQTADVGSRPAGASWVGALDLSGNVWEWVSTIYGIDDGDYDFSESGERRYSYPYDLTDGREANSEDRIFVRVLRGGSWYYTNTTNLRAPNRDRIVPNVRSNDIGFRCARSS